MTLDAPWIRVVLAGLAGAAAALAHPPFGLVPGVLAYGAIQMLADGGAGRRPTLGAFGVGLAAGFVYFLVGCWWVAEAFLVDAEAHGWMAPIAAAGLPVLLAPFWGAATALYRRLRPGSAVGRAVVFAAAFAAFEWLRGRLFTGFPWNLPGETWAAGSPLSQGAALVGAYGLTFLTVLVAGLLWTAAARRGARGPLLAAGAAAVLTAGLYGWGAARLAAADAGRTEVRLRVVQPDIPQAAKYDAALFGAILGRYASMTSGSDADVVVWPEGALPVSAADILDPAAPIRPVLASILRPGQVLMIGAWRTERRDGRLVYYNSLLTLRRAEDDVRVEAVYDKHRLVPFGEYLPLEDLMTRLGVKKLVQVGEGFSPGPRPGPMALAGLPAVQPLVCYEALFPGFTGAAVRRGAARPGWIVNVSNDAWFGKSYGPRQHLNQAGYRAIEEGLPLVRATPTGVSAVMDAYGRSDSAERLEPQVSGVIDAHLPRSAPPTIYARTGDAPLLTVIFLILAGSGSRQYFRAQKIG